MSEKHTCCEIVYEKDGVWASNHICGKTAKYERDGKHYCGIHDPVSIVERQRKRNEKNKPQREREAFEGRKRWYAGDMLEILERLHTNDGVPVDEVDELIKKVRGGYE